METWREIKGFPNYQISNLGRVKSIQRNILYKNRGIHPRKELILKSGRDSRGYCHITVSLGNKTTTFLLHRLIAKYFIPNPENKLEVNHINGIKDDNRLKNLEWCTKLENMHHAFKYGLMKNTGSHTGIRKLSNDDIVEILQLHQMYGINQSEVARQYNVAPCTICKLVKNKKWLHI